MRSNYSESAGNKRKLMHNRLSPMCNRQPPYDLTWGLPDRLSSSLVLRKLD